MLDSGHGHQIVRRVRELTLTWLQVSDLAMPANVASTVRYIRIVSPCESVEYHCPSLTPACGTASCPIRATLSTAEPPPPSVHLVGQAKRAVQLSAALFSSQSSTVVSVRSACGDVPPISLAVCAPGQLPAAGCGLLLNDSEGTNLHGSEIVRPACEDPADLAACDLRCSYQSALLGHCPVGVHAFEVATFDERSLISEWLPIEVRTLLPTWTYARAATRMTRPSGACSTTRMHCKLIVGCPRLVCMIQGRSRHLYEAKFLHQCVYESLHALCLEWRSAQTSWQRVTIRRQLVYSNVTGTVHFGHVQLVQRLLVMLPYECLPAILGPGPNGRWHAGRQLRRQVDQRRPPLGLFWTRVPEPFCVTQGASLQY